MTGKIDFGENIGGSKGSVNTLLALITVYCDALLLQGRGGDDANKQGKLIGWCFEGRTGSLMDQWLDADTNLMANKSQVSRPVQQCIGSVSPSITLLRRADIIFVIIDITVRCWQWTIPDVSSGTDLLGLLLLHSSSCLSKQNHLSWSVWSPPPYLQRRS